VSKTSIVLRTPSGLSGDMLVTGLARLAGLSGSELAAVVDSIGMPALSNVLTVEPWSVNAISGWRADISLTREHHHRSLADIRGIITASGMAPAAQQLANDTFTTLGRAEAQIHGIPLEEVTFHEVGALDSILDICVSSALFATLAPASFYCSPLPLCDGVIKCEHGYLASPAPAVQEMLRNVPVYGIDSEGETVTPTALAFLLASGARFGGWPEAEVVDVARVYGGRVLPGVPNGAMFFLVREPH
jgi:pyridinium-3,5-bisthiocarboxylic acid mononucleotide nickel chelatase